MRIGVIGSREFNNAALVRDVLENNTLTTDVLLVSSGKGSDPETRAWAEALQMDVVVFRPYNFVDRKAPHRPNYFYFCNKQIVDNSDKVIVFYDGKEKCAHSAYQYALEKDIDATLVNLDGSYQVTG
jgi:hypothetical protein